MIHNGSCHCGAIKFSITAPARITARRCNCSICTMTGFLHLIIEDKDFTLLQGEDNLGSYRFNTRVARHLFCRTCGVKSFYIPRSHPHGISVNVNCLDHSTIENITIQDFDGQNWEENIERLTAP